MKKNLFFNANAQGLGAANANKMLTGGGKPLISASSFFKGLDGQASCFVYAMLFAIFFSGPSSTRLGAQQTFCGVNITCVPFESGFKCSGSGNISDLSGPNQPFLDWTTVSNIPQKVVVNGIVNFNRDYTFAPGTELVFAQGAGFTIESGRTLTLEKSALRGCEDLWEGINVNYGGRIIVNGGIIRDAKIAINLPYNSDVSGRISGIASVGCTYQQNETAIQIGIVNTISTRKYELLRGGIAGNNFVGGTLIGTNNLPALYGILIYNSTPLSIGGGEPNTFTNYVRRSPTGILGFNVNLNVSNCVFRRFGDQITGNGTGVYFQSTPGTHALTFRGAGANLAFEQVGKAIDQFQGHLNATLFRGKDVYDGLLYRSLTSPPANINITGSTIEQFRVRGIEIKSDGMTLGNLFISGCTIKDNHAYKEDLTRRSLTIFETKPLPLDMNQGVVQAVTVDNGSKAPAQGIEGYGIVVSNVTNGTLRSNQVTNSDPSSQFNAFTGIWVETSNAINVLDNNARTTTPPPYITEGIQLQNSNNCTAQGNTMYGFRNGMYVLGVDCQQATICSNTFEKNFQGFALSNTASIGVQSAHENIWPSMDFGIEAVFDFPGFDKDDPTHVDRVRASSFAINDPDQTSQYWADPRNIGGEPDDNLWFVYDPSFPLPPNNSSCGGYGGGGGSTGQSTAQMVVNNTYPVYGEYSALRWEAARNLYTQLKQGPGNLLAQTDIANWFATTSNSTLGQLQDAYLAATTVGQPDESLANALATAYADMAQLSAQIYALDSLVARAPTDEDAAPLIQQRSALLDSALVRQAAYDSLANLHSQQTKQRASQWLQTLQNIGVTSIWEQNFKQILAIWLEKMATGSELDSAKMAMVQNIAEQCRYTGGYGVQMARLMLPRQTYQEDFQCGSLEERSKAIELASGIQGLYPNPANTQTTLRLAKSADCQVNLTDVFGKPLRSLRFNGLEKQLDLSDLPQGVYYLFVTLDGKQQPAQRLVVSK